MAIHKSKISGIQLPKQVNSREKWEVFNVQFLRLYNIFYSWLAHQKEDIKEGIQWDREQFAELTRLMNLSGIYNGITIYPTEAFIEFHYELVSLNNRNAILEGRVDVMEQTIQNLEARIAALESASPAP